MIDPTAKQLARWRAGKDWYHYALYEGRVCSRCQRPVPKSRWHDDHLCDDCRDDIQDAYLDRSFAAGWHPPLDYDQSG